MTLFLLFSIPFTFFLVNSFFNNEKLKYKMICLPLVIGLLLSIPFYLLYWTFFDNFFNDWTSLGLYLHYFFNRDGLGGFYISIVIFLYFHLINKKNKHSRLREITAYLTGFYFTLSIYDTLIYQSWYGSLELFIFPANRIASLVLIAISLNRAISFYDWKKYLYLGFAFIVPLISIFIPSMYDSNLNIMATIFSIVFLFIALLLYLLELKGKLIEF